MSDNAPAKAAKSMQDMALEPNRLTQVQIDAGKVVCKNVGDATTIAMLLWQSGLVPESIKNEKAAVIAVLKGVACGLDPLTSMQNIYIVNNRPTIWGDAVLALVKCRPDYAGMTETLEGKPGSVDYKATVTVRRKLQSGNGFDEVTRSFSWAEAQTAKLTGKDTYQKYPGQMLLWRARSYAVRAVFPDALMGMEFTEIAKDDFPAVAHVNDDGSVRAEVMDHPAPPEKKPANIAEAAETLKRRAANTAPAPAAEPAQEPEAPKPTPAPEPAPAAPPVRPAMPSNETLIREALAANAIDTEEYDSIIASLGYSGIMPELMDGAAVRNIIDGIESLAGDKAAGQ